MKFSVQADEAHQLPPGADLHVVQDNEPVATFGAFVQGSRGRAGGEMALTLVVPFGQVMNAMPVMKFVGGVVFKVTIERVPLDELPRGGWE